MARSLEEIAAKRWEVSQQFTPSTPVTTAEAFAGRAKQLFRIVDAIAERGRHVILFGERGVGKTSLIQIVPFLVPQKTANVRYMRVPAFPDDNFDSIARRIFRKIKFSADIGQGEQEYDASEAIAGSIGPDSFLEEFARYNDNDVPIVVIDEFNEVRDPKVPLLLANTIKALSDAGTNVTIVVVGVADNVSQLISEHASIQRCTEEIPMPRMAKEDLMEVLTSRLRKLDFTITGDAKWKIVNLAKGLPAYVHALGKYACLNALMNGGRLSIDEKEVDAAIDALVKSTDQSHKDDYEAATRSNQPGNLLRQVLTACALARPDDYGFFVPAAVKEPLSAILGRNIEIANFQNHLLAFIDTKRGAILERRGVPRAYRFRFREPAMQPYVIMRGIAENLLDDKAKQVLSYPEQPELFPNAT